MFKEGMDVVKTKFLESIVGVIDWVVWILLFIREELCPSPAYSEAYQGGEAILPVMEVMRVQPALLDKLGDKKALILQKFHEWVLVNQKKGSKYEFDGEIWTPGSSTYWHDNHFGWFTEDWLKKLFRQLEIDGLLISTTDAPFCYGGQKAYRLNYAKIKSLVPVKKVPDARAESSHPPMSKFPQVGQKVTDNNSSNTSEESQKSKQEKQTTATTARAQIDDPPVTDGDGAVEVADCDSCDDCFEGTGDFDPVIREDVSVTAGMDFAPPDSAASPPDDSDLIRQLQADLKGSTELTDVKAKILIDRHGAKRCRAVADWTLDEMARIPIDNPVGWWIAELTKRTVGIDETYVRKNDAARREPDRYVAGEWADIVKS